MSPAPDHCAIQKNRCMRTHAEAEAVAIQILRAAWKGNGIRDAPSNIEKKVHDVPVLHHIVLALHTQDAVGPAGGLAGVAHVVGI